MFSTRGKIFQETTGLVNYFGHDVLPKALFAVSSLQHGVGDLKYEGFLYVNRILLELKKLKPIFFNNLNLNAKDPLHVAFSDASQGISSNGQNSYTSGLYFGNDMSGIFYAIAWVRSKQKLVFFHQLVTRFLLLLHLRTEARTLLK